MQKPDTKLKLIADDIYYDGEKVATIIVPTSTLRDRFTEVLFELEDLIDGAYQQGHDDGHEEGYSEGFAEGKEEGAK